MSNRMRTDLAEVATQCTTFLDRCAAEAAAQRWFPANSIAHRRRSTVMARALAAIAEHGPLTALALRPLIGHERSATEKAVRTLREEGYIVVVGKTHTGGQLYAVAGDATDE